MVIIVLLVLNNLKDQGILGPSFGPPGPINITKSIDQFIVGIIIFVLYETKNVSIGNIRC